ncbi:golgin subfamily A member 6-like protein 22 [Coregonus clupeaformis]|uniref:golgin subfamily A member 6-like protein 22 n=1 Tax=Coregonus clupeaformis TaxID=59861 RepID=UPI001E1C6DC5|nr:golgin subfamily A member 6-like protein 22 [Coregonus clupeaformis]
MGEEQQMLKKQARLTETLSDRKRRDGEERKEDENKCVKEAREGDRRELLKEKRLSAEENMTHMEKQMRELEVKDSSIFSAGAEVKQTQCKDVSMVTATESKTLNPQKDQPANQGVAKVPQVLQVKVSKKSESVQKKDGNDKVTAAKTEAELLMDKFERMAEEERIWPCQKDRRDKDQAKEIEGKRKEEEVLSKEEQRRLRNEKALQEHLDRVKNPERTGKQTRQPQCKDYSIFTASGLKSKDPHDQQSAKCKDFSVFSTSSQGVAKVPQVKVSNKSESVQKKDWNDKVTAPKTDAELIMDKYERMAEEGRRGPCQKDRRDKDQAKEIEGKRKEEEVLSKEEQRRLRNEKALQEHLDRIENPELTGKQTRQPQCKDYSIFTASGLKSKDPHDQQSAKCKDFSVFSTSSQGVAKVPQVKVSNKSESVQKKDGNDKVTVPKTDAELIMDKYERMAEEGRRGPCQKDRRDKDQAKEIEGKRKEEEVLSKEEQRRLRNEKALQEHLDRIENPELTGKQTRQPQCKDYSIFTASGLKSKDPHDQQSAKCKDVSMVTATESKTLNPQKDQPAKCKEFSVFSMSSQGVAKVPQVLQVKVSKKSESVQKKDGNDKVTAPKTEAELLMDKFERMAEEERIWPCQKDRRDKDQAKEIEGKRKEEEVLSKEEQRRLRNEKALQEHLDRVKNPEKTGKQTRQPQCKDYSIFTASGLKSKDPHDQQSAKCKDFSVFSTSSQGVAKVPQVLQVKVSNKSESVQKKDGNDKVTAPKTEAELLMDKFERMAEEERIWPCQKDRRDKDQAKEIEGKRKEQEVLSKEEQRRLRNEKALQEHLDRIENPELRGKQTRQPQCKDYSIFTASGLKSKDPHDQQSAKCKEFSVFSTSSQGVAKVPQVLQVKVSNKSESVQKKDGNDKVTAPKTEAELLMDKFERMAEEERIWPCQKDRRDKDQAKEIDGKRKDKEVLSKEEQRRLRNEKALQEHLDRVKNPELTGKQTRQPQCKDYSIFTASGLKSKDPHDQQSAKCKDLSIFSADAQTQQCKDFSVFSTSSQGVAKVPRFCRSK